MGAFRRRVAPATSTCLSTAIANPRDGITRFPEEIVNYRQNVVLEALRQVQVFLDGNASIVGSAIAKARQNLDGVVSTFTSHAAAQETGGMHSVGETARQRTLRATLRKDYMAPIAEVAKQKLRDVPEFHALVMPASNSSTAQLAAHAAAMADAAKAHAQVLTDAGLPDDLVAGMLSLADDLSKSLDDRKQHSSKKSGATAGLAAEEGRGRSMLKLINALILPKLRNNDALLREWKAAKKVPKKPGVVATVVSQVAAAVAPPPAVSPAPAT